MSHDPHSLRSPRIHLRHGDDFLPCVVLGRGDAVSMIRCEQCEWLIDSDDDPECFVYVGNYKRLHAEIVLCEKCRDDREAEQCAQDDAADRCVEMSERAGII